MSWADLVGALADLIASRRPGHVLRVAVDGPDAAGKTTLADELAGSPTGRRAVIRAGIDGFHRLRDVRLRRGSLWPEGLYLDSFDYDAIRRAVLDPLSPGGDRRYRTAVFDHRTDAAVLGGPDVVRERYERRCLPGQRLYRMTVEPERAADVVIDNDDPVEPRVVKWPV